MIRVFQQFLLPPIPQQVTTQSHSLMKYISTWLLEIDGNYQSLMIKSYRYYPSLPLGHIYEHRGGGELGMQGRDLMIPWHVERVAFGGSHGICW